MTYCTGGVQGWISAQNMAVSVYSVCLKVLVYFSQSVKTRLLLDVVKLDDAHRNWRIWISLSDSAKMSKGWSRRYHVKIISAMLTVYTDHIKSMCIYAYVHVPLSVLLREILWKDLQGQQFEFVAMESLEVPSQSASYPLLVQHPCNENGEHDKVRMTKACADSVCKPGGGTFGFRNSCWIREAAGCSQEEAMAAGFPPALQRGHS